MKKAIGAVALVIFLVGCWRVNQDVSNDPRYPGLIGRQFRTKEDLVVAQSKGSKYPAFHVITETDITIPRPDKLKEKPFPYWYYDTKVLGIFPPGSEFKITMVRRKGASNNAFIYTFGEVVQSADTQWVGKVLEVSDVVDADDQEFSQRLVEEVK